jgi:protein AbiQ
MKNKKIIDYAFLSLDFYKHYNHAQYPEISCKVNRPYIVCLVKIDRLTFAIPFRSNIKHSASLITDKESGNPKKGYPGIDFSKTVVINNNRYIDKRRHPSISHREFVFLENKGLSIIRKLKHYISGYKKVVSLGRQNFVPPYRYSSLQYFHAELGIKTPSNKKQKELNKTIKSDPPGMGD